MKLKKHWSKEVHYPSGEEVTDKAIALRDHIMLSSNDGVTVSAYWSGGILGSGYPKVSYSDLEVQFMYQQIQIFKAEMAGVNP